MIGTVYPSEMKWVTDKKTGVEKLQLTSRGINVHMYFTDNAFDLGNKKLYFLSNRSHGYEGELMDIFELSLESGEIRQLTDEPDGISLGGFTKTADSRYIGYIIKDHILKLLDTQSGEVRILYKNKKKTLHNLSFSCDQKRVGFIMEEIPQGILPDGGANYVGFREKMYAVKEGIIAEISIDGTDFREIFRDTCWVNHFQYSPVNPRLAMFCHEGPWNEVLQRIWLIQMDSGEVLPCFRQGEDDCVGHEFWLKNGDIVFDNRRAGHDGTISSDKTQVFMKKEVKETSMPYFGFAHTDGGVYRQVAMPYYCNHYISNEDATLFAGDTVTDIVLIRVREDRKTEICTLVEHNTTWKYQRSHCHPTFSWDGRLLLYAADTDEKHGNLFLVQIPEKLI